ncbi:MAG: cupin domain-containing protein [Gammaproteobacteria bacterium]|jgi:uncharacterized cupin superfamily protein|nr:cupin domain-containing protein [Gammaproteobacteria bacterium]
MKYQHITLHKILFAALLSFGLISSTAIAQESPTPVRLNSDNMAGIDLISVPNSYADILTDGEMNIRVASLYDGEEIDVSIFESTGDGTTTHRNLPFRFEEFVYVLSGKLILTEPNGTKHEFAPGQSVVVPIGYVGDWSMEGTYRELVVVMNGNAGFRD